MNSQLNTALLEISMGIGSSLQLDKMVNDTITAYLRQLNCAGIAIFRKEQADFSLYASKPKNLIKERDTSEVIGLFRQQIEIAEEEYFKQNSHYQLQNERKYYYFFTLKEFGYMLIVKNRQPFSMQILKAILPLNQKFSNSILASLDSIALVEKQAELFQKDKQLLHQTRLAQMGEMISMIAHQWRQPLGAIASTAINLKMKFMFDDYDLNQHKQQALCKAYFEEQLVFIEEQVQNLTNTVDDFRNYYKPNKKSVSTDVNDSLLRALRVIKKSLEIRNITVKEALHSTKEIPLYENEIMQVFLNILKNAQDNFADKETQNAYMSIETCDIEDGVQVKFYDNGGGIDEKNLEKIFDPYFSTKIEKNGTGLGLYMSKMIIEEHHNGKLTVENIDDGVQFIIILKEKL